MRENGLLLKLIGTLEGLPNVKVSCQNSQIRISDQGLAPFQLNIEFKSSGYPRDLKQTAQKLLGSSSPKRIPLIAAPSISPGAREMLREMKVGYWDLGGSLYLKLPSALYFIDKPAPQPPRKVRDIYRGSSAQVVHAILLEPKRRWGVAELAEHAQVSLSTVHAVLTHLEKQLWVEKTGRGPATVRVLVEPAALLDDWASRHSLKRYEKHRYFAMARDQEELTRLTLEVLDPMEIEYVFTLWSGAAHIAPFRTGPPLVSLLAPNLPPNWNSIALDHGFQPAESGHNFEILIVPDRSPLMYSQTIHSLKIASNIQLYLDLWSWPQRGKEQAQHLRKQRIQF